MSFSQFLPGVDWREHIAAYWVRKTESDGGGSGRRVYADGCADLICNAGDSVAYFYPMADGKRVIPLYPGRLYLGGTMTAYGVLKSEVGCLLTGIRFWPGGFYALFSQPMQPAVDATIEFLDAGLCAVMGETENLDGRLDQWFGGRVMGGVVPGGGGSAIGDVGLKGGRGQKVGRYDFGYLRRRMYESGGLASVEALAEEMFVSSRTLERIFIKNVGIAPKEFLLIIRFQELLRRLRGVVGEERSGNKARVATRESLLRIAFELGYYDHAHLTKEFKKYAGILPSELSDFYKTGISGGQYF